LACLQDKNHFAESQVQPFASNLGTNIIHHILTTEMSPSKPARVLKVLVPKHNSERLGAAAAAAVKEHALVEKKKFLGNGTKALVSHVAKAASSVSVFGFG
jgi:hypothetical protein